MRDALTIVAERMALLKPATGTEAATPGALMYLTGFPLKRKPDSIDSQGRSVFEVSDCFEAANKAFKFLHGDIPTPISDRRYDAMMLERQEREKAELYGRATSGRRS